VTRQGLLRPSVARDNELALLDRDVGLVELVLGGVQLLARLIHFGLKSLDLLLVGGLELCDLGGGRSRRRARSQQQRRHASCTNTLYQDDQIQDSENL